MWYYSIILKPACMCTLNHEGVSALSVHWLNGTIAYRSQSIGHYHYHSIHQFLFFLFYCVYSDIIWMHAGGRVYAIHINTYLRIHTAIDNYSHKTQRRDHAGATQWSCWYRRSHCVRWPFSLNNLSSLVLCLSPFLFLLLVSSLICLIIFVIILHEMVMHN